MSRVSRGPSRRDVIKSAVAIGGASALAACLEREGDPDVAQGDPEERPTRQHAWNEHLARDDDGNYLLPEHHLLLALEYDGEEPTTDERAQLEEALRTLERAYTHGNEGLAFTIGYGPEYFDRFDEEIAGVSLPAPESLTSFESPTLDSYDALIHLASDYGHVVLGAEEALTGEKGELNGIEVTDTLEGIFSVAERRTGFVGEGLPADKQEGIRGIPDTDPVPEDAPFFMGFKSGFVRNQATEDSVTISEGPFADGTTLHCSRIRLMLEQWYNQDSREQRVGKMFCPVHAQEDRVEGAGHNLGNSSGVDDCIEDAERDVASRGMVGHAQKAARARDNGDPLLLRRDFNSTDDDEAGLHFLSVQQSISDFVEVRTAMTGEDLTEGAVGSRTNNGILQYMRVRNRGNYLIPPRHHRSLPTPNPA